MTTIAVLSAKGGTGKSTLANELAFSLDRTGTPYSYLDVDGQEGGAHTESIQDGAQIQIIDTPAGPDEEDLADWCRIANVAVVPLRPSPMDTRAFSATVDAIRDANPECRIIAVLNGWTRWTSSTATAEWLKATYPDMPVLTVRQSEMVPQAAMLHVSVLDRAPKGRIAQDIRTFVNTVRTAAGIGEEEEWHA